MDTPAGEGAYIPLVLVVGTRPVLVVGGGRVAEDKCRRLLAAGTRVTVVAPHVTPQLAEWTRTGRVNWQPREVAPGDVADAALVVAATDRPECNRRVADWARQARVLVNCVDDPAYCDVFAMREIRRGDLLVAVSTCGRVPALASWVGQWLEGLLETRWAQVVADAAQARHRARDAWRDPDRRRRLLAAILRRHLGPDHPAGRVEA